MTFEFVSVFGLLCWSLLRCVENVVVVTCDIFTTKIIDFRFLLLDWTRSADIYLP